METYRILIVEDDKEIREGIEIYLKNQGYEVLQAKDGEDGLSCICRQAQEGKEVHLAIVDGFKPVS